MACYETVASSQQNNAGPSAGVLPMKLISSLLVAVVGLAIMAWAYFGYVRLDRGGALVVRTDLPGRWPARRAASSQSSSDIFRDRPRTPAGSDR